MGRKLLLKTNDEILRNKGRMQKFSSYPQLKPRVVIEGDETSKEYREEIKKFKMNQWK